MVALAGEAAAMSSGQLLPLFPEGCTISSSELQRSNRSSCCCCGCCTALLEGLLASRPGTASENDTCRWSGWCWLLPDATFWSLTGGAAAAVPPTPLPAAPSAGPAPAFPRPLGRLAGTGATAGLLPAGNSSLTARRPTVKLRSAALLPRPTDDEKLALTLLGVLEP